MLTGSDYVTMIDNYRYAVEKDRPDEADAMKQAFKVLVMRGCDNEAADMVVRDAFDGQF